MNECITSVTNANVVNWEVVGIDDLTDFFQVWFCTVVGFNNNG